MPKLDYRNRAVSLKQAAHLKTLGFPQKGLFWWKKDKVTGNMELGIREASAFAVVPTDFFAPMTDDIIEFLAAKKINMYRVFIHGNYWRFTLNGDVNNERFSSPAEAYGGLLIKVLELNEAIKNQFNVKKGVA